MWQLANLASQLEEHKSMVYRIYNRPSIQTEESSVRMLTLYISFHKCIIKLSTFLLELYKQDTITRMDSYFMPVKI